MGALGGLSQVADSMQKDRMQEHEDQLNRAKELSQTLDQMLADPSLVHGHNFFRMSKVKLATKGPKAVNEILRDFQMFSDHGQSEEVKAYLQQKGQPNLPQPMAPPPGTAAQTQPQPAQLTPPPGATAQAEPQGDYIAFLSPEERTALALRTQAATLGVQEQAKLAGEQARQKAEIDALTKAGVPLAAATELAITGRYAPRQAVMRAVSGTLEGKPSTANYDPNTGKFHDPATGEDISDKFQMRQAGAGSKFFTYYNAVKAENPDLSDDQIALQYTARMARAGVVPTTTTTSTEEAPGVVKVTTATKQAAGGQPTQRGAGLTPPPSGAAPTGSQPIVPRLDQASITLGRTAHVLRPKIPMIIALASELDKEGKLGPVLGRWQDFLTGKVGAGDEKFAQLRSMVKMFTTGTMRAHLGSRGGQMLLAHFTSIADASKMDLPTLRGSLAGIDEFLKGYEDMVFNSRGSMAPPPSGERIAIGRHYVGEEVTLRNGTKHIIKKVHPDGSFE